MPQPSFLTASLYVAAGGGVGAWLRFCVGRLMVAWLGPIKASAFPWGTLTVNVVGSIMMGLLIGWFARFGSHGEGARLLLAVGVLGGFTTFSSFSMEVVNLAERGQIATAAAYAAVSLAAGIAGLVAGLHVMRSAA